MINITLVAPIAKPISARRELRLGTARLTGDAGCQSRAVNTHADTMKIPSPAPSIAYSGKWRVAVTRIGSSRVTARRGGLSGGILEGTALWLIAFTRHTIRGSEFRDTRRSKKNAPVPHAALPLEKDSN
jgi:hypothetical protein